MSTPAPYGIIPALSTPTSEGGEVDEESLRSLVRRNLEWGVHGVAVSILAGEFYKFSDRERARTFELVTDEVDGRVPVWAGVSHLGTDPAVELARRAKDFGCDGIIAMPSLVSRDAALAVHEHFASILSRIDMPLMIQDAEDFNGVHMWATFYRRLADEFSNFVAVKVEGDQSLEKIRDIKSIVGDRLTIISGRWAMLLFEELDLGAQGNIPDGCMADMLVEAFDDYRSGRCEHARVIFSRYKRWVDFVNLHMRSFHEVEKETLRLRGMVRSSHTRAPHIQLGDGPKEELRALLAQMGLIEDPSPLASS